MSEYNEIINIQWSTANAQAQIDALIAKAEAAQKRIEALSASSNTVGAPAGTQAAVAQSAPAWYTKPPDWFAQSVNITPPRWYTTPPTWFGGQGISAQQTPAAVPVQSVVPPIASAATAPQSAIHQAAQIVGGTVVTTGNEGRGYGQAIKLPDGTIVDPYNNGPVPLSKYLPTGAASSPFASGAQTIPVLPLPGVAAPGSIGALSAAVPVAPVAVPNYKIPPMPSPEDQMSLAAKLAMQQERNVSSWQQQQIQFASRMAIQRENEQMQLYQGSFIDTTGLNRRSGLADALRHNIGVGKSEIQDLQFERWRAGQMGDTDAVKKYTGDINAMTRQVDAYQESLRKATDTSSLFNNQLTRHAMWVVQGAAIAAVFAGIAAAVATAVQEYTKLSDVSARLGGMGAAGGKEGAVESLIGQYGKYGKAAAYGIDTNEAGQAALMEQRLKTTPEMQQQGRELSVVYGTKEYNNILTELYQTKRNLNAVGLQEYNVMDTLASIYNRVTGSAETAFDSVQASLQIYKQLGVSAEMAAVALARASVSMEATPEVTAMSIQRLIKNVGTDTTKAGLEQYGIDTSQSASKTIQQIIPIMNTLRRDSGDSLEAEQRFVDFMNLVSNAGMQSAGQAQKMAQVLIGLGEMFAEADKPLDKMDKLVANVMDSATMKVEKLKASWQVLIATMVDTPVITIPIEFATNVAKEWTDEAAELKQFAQIPEEDKKKYGEEFKTYYTTSRLKREGWTDEQLNDPNNARALDFEKQLDYLLANDKYAREYNQYVLSKAFPSTGYRGMNPDTAAQNDRPDTSALQNQFADLTGMLNPTLIASQNLQTLPGGQSYLKLFQSLYAGQQSKLKAAGFQDQTSDQVTALTDPFGRVIPGSQAKYDKEANRLAMAELERLQQYTFVDSIKGVSGSMLQSQVEKERTKLEQVDEYKTTREFNVKTFQYYDETTKTFREIRATQEEMNGATKSINEKMNQIKGTFNVPEGGTVMVAMQALMEGYTDKSRLPKPDTEPPATGGGDRTGSIWDAVDKYSNWYPGKKMTGGIGMDDARSAMSNWYPGKRIGGYSADGKGRTTETGGTYLDPTIRNSRMAAGNANISITNPVTVNSTLTVNLDGRVIANSISNKQYTQTNQQSRVAPGGGGGGRAMMTL